MFNMIKEEYKKIKLRDFRQNLTQLKDSLANGQVYEVMDRGESLGYFVPASYDMELKKKKKMTDEEFLNLLFSLKGKIKLRTKDQTRTDYMNIYRENLEKKYLKK